MSTTQPHSLPDNPSLENLRKQAKDLVKSRKRAHQVLSLREAQRQIASRYGFKAWADLKAHIDGLDRAVQLKQAIDREDLEAVRRLLKEDPSLHRAKLGYNHNGPLTWAAECRGATPPSKRRLAMVKLMIEMGSDLHQGGDGPLMRASLGDRLAMMKLLIAHGADVNAVWDGHYPIILGPCECLDPKALKFLLDRGADPSREGSKYGYALDMVIGTYARSPQAQHECAEALFAVKAPGKYRDLPSVAIHRGRLDLLAKLLAHDPALLHRRHADFTYGETGHRGLDLRGATLLHVAAEYCESAAVEFLLHRGADVNARALVDKKGRGGQTPIFHAVTQHNAAGLECARLLIEAGADLGVAVTIRGAHDQPDEYVTVTPLGYAARFPYGHFRARGATELLVKHKARAGDLYAAAQAGYANEARELIAAGADVNIKGPDGDSALAAAIATRHLDVAELLLNAGADLSLADACSLGRLDKVQELLQRAPQTVKEPVGQRKWTPLFYAAVGNHVAVLDVLRKHGAGLTDRDWLNQRTPLHRAIEAGASDAVEWLLEHGVDANIVDWTGNTPLHVAASKGSPLQIIRSLLNHGASVSAVAGGKTPLDIAFAGKHRSVAAFLRGAGAKKRS